MIEDLLEGFSRWNEREEERIRATCGREGLAGGRQRGREKRMG